LVGCSTGISAGFRGAQNFVDDFGGAPGHIREVRSVGHQTSGQRILSNTMHGDTIVRRSKMTRRADFVAEVR